LTGDVPSARGLWDQAAAWLPVEGAVNSQGRWEALQAMVSGAALIGDRDRLSALDQLAQQFERRKVAVSNLSVGPNTASLTAALTANACRRFDEAREHFEAARRVARDLPNRILEPNVEYWSGRFDLEQGRRDQGLPRLRAAVEGFTACGMVLHRALAERALQET
jgi:hypothetical protein